MSSAFFIVVAVFAIGLVALLFWTLRAAEQRKRQHDGLSVLENAPRHLCNMASIRQSLDAVDLHYVQEKGGQALARQVRRERRRVAFLYLSALRRDFEQLLRIARVVALLSPEISGAYEYERLRLSLTFRVRFQMVRLRFLLGDAAMPELGKLGEMVTSLSLQMETAMRQLGERAVLAAELALHSER